jgi:hypothetical protein
LPDLPVQLIEKTINDLEQDSYQFFTRRSAGLPFLMSSLLSSISLSKKQEIYPKIFNKLFSFC